jgi:hypothetical protein
VSVEEIKSALLNVSMSAAPFIHGRGMERARRQLLRNVKHASELLKLEIVDPQAEAGRVEHLRELAEAADVECAARPGYRADLEG